MRRSKSPVHSERRWTNTTCSCDAKLNIMSIINSLPYQLARVFFKRVFLTLTRPLSPLFSFLNNFSILDELFLCICEMHTAHARRAGDAHSRCSRESVIKILMRRFLLLTRLHSINTTSFRSQNLVSGVVITELITWVFFFSSDITGK